MKRRMPVPLLGFDCDAGRDPPGTILALMLAAVYRNRGLDSLRRERDGLRREMEQRLEAQQAEIDSLRAELKPYIRRRGCEFLAHYSLNPTAGGRCRNCRANWGAAHHEKIVLLLADVIMPDMSGPQLANELWMRNPNLRRDSYVRFGHR